MATVQTQNSSLKGTFGVDIRAFVERCSPGRLLCFAVNSTGDLLTISPALLAALGTTPDTQRVSRLIQGDEPGFTAVGTLHLIDGTRVVGFAETSAGRLDRQLKSFADANRLTDAERAALADIASGASAKESAQRLGLSPETVRARRKRIFRKVGADGCGSILAKLLRE
jgi:DNA-binding CsgD family transcriptional regulator